MNRLKFRRVICALLLILVTASSLLPVQAKSEVSALEILSGFGKLTSVPKTPYLLAQSENGKAYGVYHTDGNRLISVAYGYLDYKAFNCFLAARKTPVKVTSKTKTAPALEDINCYALVTADGTQVSDYLYGNIEVLNTYWACGWVLEESANDESDWNAAKTFYYRIQRCDLIYLGDHAIMGKRGTQEVPPPLSLTREEYKTAKAHGQYLYVQDRQDQIKIYDSRFNLVNAEVKSLNDSMYVIRNYSVALRNTAEIMADGFSAVKEVQTDAGLLLSATRLDYSGDKWSTVFTVEGEQLMPVVKGDVETLTADYAVLNNNQKRGLYSLREKRLLAPCAFDKIVANANCLDPYVQHGYVCVEKDKTTYYLHVADGTLYESANPGSGWKKAGLTYVQYDANKSRVHVAKPDQSICDLKNAKTANLQDVGSGYLLSLTSSAYGHMLVTWDGDVLLKSYAYAFTITNDDKAIVQKKNGTYSLFAVAFIESLF